MTKPRHDQQGVAAGGAHTRRVAEMLLRRVDYEAVRSNMPFGSKQPHNADTQCIGQARGCFDGLGVLVGIVLLVFAGGVLR